MIVVYDNSGLVFAIMRGEDRTRLIDDPYPVIEIDDVVENFDLLRDLLNSPTGTYHVVSGELYKGDAPVVFATYKQDAIAVALDGFNGLPEWSTWTYSEARDGVRSRIFNGWTQIQVDAWIDSTATNAAGIAGVRVALKQVGAAILAIRTILEAMAQAIVFLRDLVVRFWR